MAENPRRRPAQAGFTLFELLVAMAITTVIMGATLAAFSHAMQADEATTLLLSTNANLRNGRTGARRLDLPLVQMGAQPVDLIRRPAAKSAEDVNNAAMFGQRYFKRASLRILLSDTAADLLSLPSVTPTAPVRLADLRPAATYGGNLPAWYPIDATHALVASAGGTVGGSYASTNGYWMATYQPLIDGYIKIEVQLTDMTTWVDVTSEILGLGFAGRAPLSPTQSRCSRTTGTTSDRSDRRTIRRTCRARGGDRAPRPGTGWASLPARGCRSSSRRPLRATRTSAPTAEPTTSCGSSRTGAERR